MRIHTNTFSMNKANDAITTLGLSWERLTPHRSRSHVRALDVVLNGSSPRSTQSGGGKAATWDEWGQFLALLFAEDAEAKTPFYRNAEHFHWVTGGRYHAHNATFLTSCPQHRWEYEGTVATGSYSVRVCAKGCGAIVRDATRAYTDENFPVQTA